MATPVLPVFQDAQGQWVADDGPMQSSRDIITVESLERFAAAPEKVIISGGTQTLTVFRTDDTRGYVKLEDVQPEVLDD